MPCLPGIQTGLGDPNFGLDAFLNGALAIELSPQLFVHLVYTVHAPEKDILPIAPVEYVLHLARRV